jgi:hypothetical protein
MIRPLLMTIFDEMVMEMETYSVASADVDKDIRMSDLKL